MANYIKIEGTGGGTSGSGLINIKIYDQNNNLVLLTKNNVIEHNATIRIDEENFRVMFQEGNISPYCPYNSNKDSIYYVIEIPTEVSVVSKIELLNYSTSSYKVDTVNIYHSLDNENFNLIDTVSGLVSANTATPILNIKMINFKILLKSNNKIYSLQSEEILYETKMTSNTAPAPYVASASSELNSSSQAWKAFNGNAITIHSDGDYWSHLAYELPSHLTINFKEKRKTNFLDIYTPIGTNESAKIKKYKIQGSYDGNSWQDIIVVENDSFDETYKRIKFNKTVDYSSYRFYIYEVKGGTRTVISQLIYGIIEPLTQLPSDSIDNFINYGSSSIEHFNLINGSKNYILQYTVSENADGLWVQEIDRKPLSIKFE